MSATLLPVQAGDLQRKRAVLLVRASNKREQAFMEAHERGEFYAKQKLKLERKGLEAAQKEVGFFNIQSEFECVWMRTCSSSCPVFGTENPGFATQLEEKEPAKPQTPNPESHSEKSRSWRSPRQTLNPKP
jgi:hypothetical protein